MRRKTVFITGASGNMGREGLRQLLERRDRFRVVALVLPTKRDRRILSAYSGDPDLTIVWGDLTNYEDVLKGITGADYVLHVGGMVSPQADRDPERTERVNIGGIRNILRAIQAQPAPDLVKLVYIGSVAQTGDRNPPIHWGRTGDPIKISRFDRYAVTKTIAEREVIESGLRYWVSLRQTAILHGHRSQPARMDPIMFHIPLRGVFEWVTAEDSGRLLANVCADDVPEHFWRRIYNIGGGAGCRVTNYEFLLAAFSAFGLGKRHLEALFDPKWFALRNFHGQWFEDSDSLEDFLHFRRETFDDFGAYFRRHAPILAALPASTPAFVFKMARKLVLEPFANRKDCTLYWIRHGANDRIEAFFGSRERWQSIPGWDGLDTARPFNQPLRLNHGYDDARPHAEFDVDVMKAAAEFRGGRFLSSRMTTGDLAGKLRWQCAFGHEFEASPTLVLLAGHWCPRCLPPPWNYDEIARRNPFFAQVWPAG
ncbi:MAG: NAD(P)-dependent oxidoreductase [Bryobacteraceae bacterium]